MYISVYTYGQEYFHMYIWMCSFSLQSACLFAPLSGSVVFFPAVWVFWKTIPCQSKCPDLSRSFSYVYPHVSFWMFFGTPISTHMGTHTHAQIYIYTYRIQVRQEQSKHTHRHMHTHMHTHRCRYMMRYVYIYMYMCTQYTHMCIYVHK